MRWEETTLSLVRDGGARRPTELPIPFDHSILLKLFFRRCGGSLVISSVARMYHLDVASKQVL